MPIPRKEVWSFLKETGREWSNDDATRLGAALAYYTVFSLAPLLLIVLFIVGVVWSGQQGTARTEIVNQMTQLLGKDGARMIQGMLDNVGPNSGGVLATVLGIGALLFGATGVFAQLQASLNKIWEVRSKSGGIRGFAMKRLLSFGVILVIGFLLLVSLVLSAALSAVDTLLSGLSPLLHLLYQTLNIIVSIGIITLLFAFIFRYLPDVQIAWRDVWTGALVTAVLFTLGKWGIGWYLGNSSVGSAYGAAGSLVLLLLWVYYSALIFFFGAELTQVYARRYGSRIEPDDDAVRVASYDESDTPAETDTPDEADAPGRADTTVPAPARSRGPSPWKRAVPVVVAFFVGRLWGRRRRD